MALRKKIIIVMKKKSITQAFLAEKLGIPQGNISRFLHGKINFNVDKIDRILLFLGLEIYEKK